MLDNNLLMKQNKMFHQFHLCIIILASSCCEGYIFDIQHPERQCLYRCRGSAYDLVDMDKRLKHLSTTLTSLVSLENRYSTFSRGINAEMNILTAKISKLERENEALKKDLEKEKNMRISLQSVVHDEKEALNRIQALVSETKEFKENSNLKMEAVENRLENLNSKVKSVIENGTDVQERLKSAEGSIKRAANLVEEVSNNNANDIVSIMHTLSNKQSEQKRLLKKLEDQTQSLANGLYTVYDDMRNMSRQVEYLEQQVEGSKQKGFSFADVNALPSLTLNDKQQFTNSFLQRGFGFDRKQNATQDKNSNNARQRQSVSLTRRQRDTAETSTSSGKSDRHFIQLESPSSISDYVASSPGVCRLEKASGQCGKSYKRWYYDSCVNECFEFTYGGCLGNENRFSTKTACEEMCKL